MKRRFISLVFGVMLAAGCGGGSGSGGGGGDATSPEDAVEADAPPEGTPPEFRDVRVEIHASPSISLDLNNQDVERVLPMAFPAVFTVFTTDDESAAESIVVTVLEGNGDVPAEGQEAAFANGIWTVAVPAVGPGQTWRVRVEDGAGNSDVWVHALIIPPLDEAVVGDWDTRWYTEEGVHSHTWEAVWSADGTWEESRQGTELTGTWALDGDLLTVDTLTKEGTPNPPPVPQRVVSAFYVDETYFAASPMERVGEGSGVTGEWTHETDPWRDEDGEGFVLVHSGRYTYSYEEGGAFTMTFEGTADGVPDQVRTTTGNWVLVPNENYIENYGDYLVTSLEETDGEPLPQPIKVVSLMVIRHELLLLSPKVRAF